MLDHRTATATPLATLNSDAALSFANELRAMDALPPVAALEPGARGEIARCPIAATAGAGLAAGHWEIGTSALRISPRGAIISKVVVPREVLQAVASFDAPAGNPQPSSSNPS